MLVPQEETARSKQMAAGSIPAWRVTAQVSALPPMGVIRRHERQRGAV